MPTPPPPPLRCPICKKPAAPPPPPPSPYPFCSDRCKLIDLGRWLDGVYQIPVDDPAERPAPPDDPPPPRR